MIVKSSVMDILVMGMSPQVVVCKLYLEGIPLFRQLYFTSDVCYNEIASETLPCLLGMTGFDGRGWFRDASRARTELVKSVQTLSANRTSYAAMPLAA